MGHPAGRAAPTATVPFAWQTPPPAWRPFGARTWPRSREGGYRFPAGEPAVCCQGLDLLLPLRLSVWLSLQLLLVMQLQLRMLLPLGL